MRFGAPSVPWCHLQQLGQSRGDGASKAVSPRVTCPRCPGKARCDGRAGLMCGIAGVAGPAPGRSALLTAMSDALAHRGPDEAGTYEGDDVALAIRRLSIIDVAGGHQPYANERRTIHAVFNGEIYGFAALRRRLENAGHTFGSRADGEVIVHAYEQFGERFIEELDGMFALAVWDSERRKLVLARDRLGKKPLFYCRHPDGSLSFASELAALLLDDRIAVDVDPIALAEYLQYGYVPSPRSILCGVGKLEPGTSLTWQPTGAVKTRRYWTLDYEPKHRLSYAEALDEFDQRARQAVAARLVSDVPLGLFLSGGIDSSFVLAQMLAAGAQTVETFAIGFPDSRYDERPYARSIAQRLGSVHHEALRVWSTTTASRSRTRRRYRASTWRGWRASGSRLRSREREETSCSVAITAIRRRDSPRTSTACPPRHGAPPGGAPPGSAMNPRIRWRRDTSSTERSERSSSNPASATRSGRRY